jgi:hypothetical protein
MEDGISGSAYMVFLGSNPIFWSTRKQRSFLSRGREYRALAAKTSEITWLSSLFRELRIPYSEPPLIFSDNTGATQLSLNPVHHH